MKTMQESTIVFAGDSIMDADKMNTYDRLGNGFIRLVNDGLKAFRPWEAYSVVNAGISGNTSADLLGRWEKDVSSQKPDIVFCMIGTNDVWRHHDYSNPPSRWLTLEDYENNLSAICEKSENIKKFYFMTPYYLEENRADRMRAEMDAYGDAMRKVAQRFNRPVLDVQARFDEYMKHRPGQSINWDRVHPQGIGSMIIARIVLETICV